MAMLGVVIVILSVDIAILRKQEGREGKGYRGREKDELSRVRSLEADWSTREFGDPKCHRGHGALGCKPILGVQSGRVLGCRGIV